MVYEPPPRCLSDQVLGITDGRSTRICTLNELMATMTPPSPVGHGHVLQPAWPRVLWTTCGWLDLVLLAARDGSFDLSSKCLLISSSNLCDDHTCLVSWPSISMYIIYATVKFTKNNYIISYPLAAGPGERSLSGRSKYHVLPPASCTGNARSPVSTRPSRAPSGGRDGWSGVQRDKAMRARRPAGTAILLRLSETGMTWAGWLDRLRRRTPSLVRPPFTAILCFCLNT